MSRPKSFLSSQLVSSGFVKAFTDQGSGADQDLTVFWPEDLSRNGLLYLGSVAIQGYPGQPSHPVYYVKAENDNPGDPCLKPPTGFTKIWTDHGDGGNFDKSIWRPIAPIGYVAIGHVGWNSYKADPTINDFPGLACVREDLAVSAEAVDPAVWGDWGSGADESVALWNSRSRKDGKSSGYFVATQGYNKPAGPLFEVKGL